MLRKASEAVSEGNAPVHQEEELGFGQPAPVDEFREIKSQFDKLKELKGRLEQHLLSQEQDARQPRFAMEEADGHANTETRARTEGAATAVQAMRGDSCTAEQKVQDGPKTPITFGVEAEPPDLPCCKDALVEEGATSSESCLPSLEMRRRWLSSHRRSLHSHGDHLQRATSSVLRDRGDESREGLEDGKFMDFDSIRLVRQQQLLETACCSLLPEGR